MQGQTQSSESIWTAFNNMTTAYTRPLRWLLKIAWNRNTTSGSFATVGSSVVDGDHVVKGIDGIFTGSDLFDYFDETARLIRAEYDRQIIEPLGGIAKGLADVLIDNTDARFTPAVDSTIGTAILPNRPIQIALGFLLGTTEKLVFIFKGLTQQPKENKIARTVSIRSTDYLEFLNQYPLDATYYQDQRADEIIADILSQVGVSSSQYELDEGLNTIGFAFFSKGQTAGDRIRRLCEAEEAFFYQDETGTIRFENRRHYLISPHSTPVWDLDPDDILTWQTDDSVPVINKVIVTGQPRTVEASQEVWRDAAEEVIPSGETSTVWANFDDPVTTLETITATTDYTAFTATSGGGSNITTSISIVVTLFTDTAKLEITNNDPSTAYVNLLKLRGTPASKNATIREEYEDSTSISKYQEKQLTISNDFIDDDSFAAYLARVIVMRYKEPGQRIKLRVQGAPQLQFRDMIRVKDLDTGVYVNYRLMRITGVLEQGYFYQDLVLRKITEFEADQWAIVGITQVGSETEVVGI